MEVLTATLAAYVELSEDGKVSMFSGDLDTLRVMGDFPAAFPLPTYFYAKFRYPVAECGHDYQARIELATADGNILLQSARPLVVPPSPNNRPVNVGFVAVFYLNLPHPGEYLIRLFHENREVRLLPLFVEQVTPDQQDGR